MWAIHDKYTSQLLLVLHYTTLPPRHYSAFHRPFLCLHLPSQTPLASQVPNPTLASPAPLPLNLPFLRGRLSPQPSRPGAMFVALLRKVQSSLTYPLTSSVGSDGRVLHAPAPTRYRFAIQSVDSWLYKHKSQLDANWTASVWAWAPITTSATI